MAGFDPVLAGWGLQVWGWLLPLPGGPVEPAGLLGGLGSVCPTSPGWEQLTAAVPPLIQSLSYPTFRKLLEHKGEQKL